MKLEFIRAVFLCLFCFNVSSNLFFKNIYLFINNKHTFELGAFLDPGASAILHAGVTTVKEGAVERRARLGIVLALALVHCMLFVLGKKIKQKI